MEKFLSLSFSLSLCLMVTDRQDTPCRSNHHLLIWCSVAGLFQAMIWRSRKEYVLKVFISPIPKNSGKNIYKVPKEPKENKNAKSNINPIYKMYQKKVRTELSSSTTHTPAKTQSKYNSLFSLSVTFDVPPTIHTNMSKWSPYILYAPPPGRNTHEWLTLNNYFLYTETKQKQLKWQ